MTPETEKRVLSLFHRVRWFSLGFEDALAELEALLEVERTPGQIDVERLIQKIATLVRREVTPTIPSDTGTTLPGPPLIAAPDVWHLEDGVWWRWSAARQQWV